MQLVSDAVQLRDHAKILPFTVPRTCVGWLILVLVSGILLGGCGREAETDHTAESAEDVIGARAQHRWDALVGGDLDEAYAMESPAFREVYSPKAYRGRFGQQLSWTSASVRTVELLDDGLAQVRVLVSYVSLGPDGRLLEGERPLTETWVYDDGGWWHSGKS